jgi:hypothetical protein
MVAASHATDDTLTHLRRLRISPEDFGHEPGTLLPPLQLVQAFANRYTVTCMQLIALLDALPLPEDPDAARALARPGSASADGALTPPAAAASKAGGADEGGGGASAKLEAERRALARQARRAAQRERVDVAQLLFAHVVDLKHFSGCMLVRGAAADMLLLV